MKSIQTLAILFVSLAVLAQEGGRSVNVNVDYPGEVGWRDTNGRYHQAGLVRGGSNYLTLPRESVTLEFHGRSLWQSWSGQCEVSPNAQDVKVAAKPGPNWITLGTLGLLGLAGLGGWRLRRQRSQAAAAQLASEPLIRSDGGLPRRPIGGYKVVSQLGSGGMGVVYKGISYDGLPVAIKVPAPHLVADESFRKRWLREIELGLELKHPRVVRVLCLPDSTEPYLILEFVEGTTLEGTRPLPWPQELKRVKRWLAESLDALGYIHSQGVIHRDLKPANLMVTKDGGIKLMDFGIAHKVHGTKLTGTDTILGTPAFMAPEQIQGKPVDERSDLYSLGLIFYDRLAGGLPFPQDLMEMMHFKLTHPLPALSTLLPEMPTELDQFLNKLIAMDPSLRFPSAKQAQEALR